ncbi:MAG: hypothetical protein EOP11_15365 [Proteobacteria bacterium]|nr:MAG: hypothetical protein EOP11_15365 [Pseudomonadota bacterium]
MKTLSLLCLSMFSVLPAFASDLSARSLKLEPLSIEKDFEGGCGCSVGRSHGENFQTLVFASFEERSPALVKLDGQVRSLPFSSSSEKARAPRVGDRFTKVYSDGSLRLTLRHKTTAVCAKEDESCEVTNYRVDASLEQGRERRVLKSLEGDCGC